MAEKKPILGNTAYDIAKDTVTIYLPAVGVLYSALAGIWGLPFAVEVVGTIAAFVTFLGVVLKISSKQYQNQEAQYDGAMVINDTDPMRETYRLEVDLSLDELMSKKDIKLKVDNPLAK